MMSGRVHARGVEPVGIKVGVVVDPSDLKSRVQVEDVIASLFGRALFSTGRPSELRCQCWRPEHAPDTKPSCRIDTDKQVFFCDVCGSGGDVFTAIRERYDYSFRQAVQWLAEHRWSVRLARPRPLPPALRPARPGRSPLGSKTAGDVYPYYDLQWRLLFEKIRTPDKRFFYRRYDRDGHKLWGLGSVEPVLYQWPALVGLPYVLVVEGEKDVAAAWDRYLPATTNPEGAGNGKWKRRYTHHLAAAGIERVYVIPDNDDVGRLHADQIVASCRDAGLRAWVVRLPGAPPHGDVSDYFEAGHSRRDVLRLMRAARRTAVER